MTPPRTRPKLPRFALVLLAAVALSAPVASIAISASPDEGTVTLQNPRITWEGKTFPEVPLMPLRDVCDVPGDVVCDEFELTADIPKSHWDSAAGGVEVGIAWENESDDFDLYAIDASGNEVASSEQAGTTSERVMIDDANADDGPYRIVVSPFSVADGATYDGGALIIDRADVAPGAGDVPTEPLSDQPCVDGLSAGVFPCKDVNLEGFLPIAELNDGNIEDPAGNVIELNDIWGWTDPETGREYALVGKSNGTAFVDITDPKAPLYLGSLPSSQRLAVVDEPVSTIFRTWRDVKVHDNHAFVVSEEPLHGMQVFDLTRLRGVTEPETWDEDALYTRAPLTLGGDIPNPEAMGSSHNIAINEESGFAYVIGTDTCDGGAHIVDINDPKDPQFAGCVSEDGYTHDTQCVNYDGPDERFAGREICFDSNEDTLTIVDVTDKANPQQLSRVTYDGASYTHQGWLTEDRRHFLINDELDEQDTGVPTTTRIFDVSRLDLPVLTTSYAKGIPSIDHNLYTVGNTVFEANYRSGLRVIDASGVADNSLTETGFFDVYPADDAAEFNGAWSNFPYYESGNVVVSGIEQGLFVLDPDAARAPQTPQSPGDGGEPTPTPTPTTDSGTPGGTPASSGGTAGTNGGATACTSSTALKSVDATRAGRGLRLTFDRGSSATVGIDVFRQAKRRKVTRSRRVARFPGRENAIVWDGESTIGKRRVGAGYYVVRYRAKGANGVETRRVALRKRGGRFVRRPAFQRAPSCDLLSLYKLRRPVFGGTGRSQTLKGTLRVSRDAQVTVTVLRRGKVIRALGESAARAGVKQRFRVSSTGLRRGTYAVRVVARRGGETVTSTLRAKKL